MRLLAVWLCLRCKNLANNILNSFLVVTYIECAGCLVITFVPPLLLSSSSTGAGLLVALVCKQNCFCPVSLKMFIVIRYTYWCHINMIGPSADSSICHGSWSVLITSDWGRRYQLDLIGLSVSFISSHYKYCTHLCNMYLFVLLFNTPPRPSALQFKYYYYKALWVRGKAL